MITKIYKVLCAGVVAVSLTACSDDFLEVQNPTGEPLEEYYMTDEHLSEACTSAYAPLHWPDWDGTAYNDLTCDAEILGDDFGWAVQASLTTSTGTSSSTLRATVTTHWEPSGATSTAVSSVVTT